MIIKLFKRRLMAMPPKPECRAMESIASEDDFERGPSELALRLSRRYRLARLNPSKAGPLNSPDHVKLVYSWLLQQVIAARGALSRIQGIPGVQVDPELTRAVDLVMQKRVEIYAATPLFFEECEGLTNSIVRYASELTRQHEDRAALRRAQVRLSEERNPAGPFSPSGLRGARAGLWAAKRSVDAKLRLDNERRIVQARAAMRAAADLVDDKFKLTTMVPDYFEFPAEDFEDLGDEEGRSGRSGPELRPRPRSRM